MALDDWSRLGDASLPAGVEKRPVLPDHRRPIYDAWRDGLAEVPTTTPASDEDYREFLDRPSARRSKAHRPAGH